MVLHGIGFLLLRGLGPRSTAIGHYGKNSTERKKLFGSQV